MDVIGISTPFGDFGFARFEPFVIASFSTRELFELKPWGLTATKYPYYLDFQNIDQLEKPLELSAPTTPISTTSLFGQKLLTPNSDPFKITGTCPVFQMNQQGVFNFTTIASPKFVKANTSGQITGIGLHLDSLSPGNWEYKAQ